MQIVWVDKNGQLGTLMQPARLDNRRPSRGRRHPARFEQLTRTVQAQQAVNVKLEGLLREQQAVNAELPERLARLEALLAPAAVRNVAR